MPCISLVLLFHFYSWTQSWLPLSIYLSEHLACIYPLIYNGGWICCYTSASWSSLTMLQHGEETIPGQVFCRTEWLLFTNLRVMMRKLSCHTATNNMLHTMYALMHTHLCIQINLAVGLTMGGLLFIAVVIILAIFIIKGLRRRRRYSLLDS